VIKKKQCRPPSETTYKEEITGKKKTQGEEEEEGGSGKQRYKVRKEKKLINRFPVWTPKCKTTNFELVAES
jgi:hypothetical protein